MFVLLCYSQVVYSLPLSLNAISLPPPDLKHHVVNFSKVLGWKKNQTPKAPVHFSVTKFAEGLQNGRWIYVAPNGDILVAESQAGRITLFRDKNNNGTPETREIFLKNLDQPFGMLVLGNFFYVANSNALWRYPYKSGTTSIEGKGEKLLDLPSGGHWTRNIVANKKGDKIYIAVGSGSNIGEYGMERENERAAIWEVDPMGLGKKIIASGLRNPVGMGFDQTTGALWTVVNERDNLGDDLVPDFLTEVKEGGFYGWPYSYWGNHIDPRVKEKNPAKVRKAIVPDVTLGAHAAPLGLTFYGKKAFPPKYQGGAFITEHGSWNRSVFAGYKVVFVPFQNGRPSGMPEDFLTGFIASKEKSEVYGRPVGIAVLSDGSLLIADDGGNVLWKVAYMK
ncbi:MAG: PQQ-dependent sugar dehydrogenase [Bacteriovorax sp.]